MQMSPLVARALQLAISQVGVREQPAGSNRGPEVDTYLRSTGLDPAAGSYPWCAAFVHWCFAGAVGATNPCPRTASALHLVALAPYARVAVPAPGVVFVIDHGGGKGHCGFVESIDGAALVTVEGNTNPSGGRDGDGVYKRTRRPDEVTAYLDFSLPR